MKKMKIGDEFIVHCYKHDGTVYTSYEKSMLLDIKHDYLVFGNYKVKVTEIDGRTWYTKEPAIIFYYKKKWFNIITQFKKTGIYYYCNIASTTIIEGNIIKYIDYDLDLRCFPDGTYKILDESEYEYHKKKMNYPNEIDMIVKNELNMLIKDYEDKKGPFNKSVVDKYYSIYMNLLSKNDGSTENCNNKKSK